MSDDEGRRGREAERVVLGRQGHRVHGGLAVGAVLVHGTGGQPDGPGRRRDPAARVGGHREQAAARVDDLVVLMPVRVDPSAGAHRGDARGGGKQGLADFRHTLAFYRKSASP